MRLMLTKFSLVNIFEKVAKYFELSDDFTYFIITKRSI